MRDLGILSVGSLGPHQADCHHLKAASEKFGGLTPSTLESMQVVGKQPELPRPAQACQMGFLLRMHTLCINRARNGRGRSLEQASGGTRPPASFQTLITQFSIEGRDGETNLARTEPDRLGRASSSRHTGEPLLLVKPGTPSRVGPNGF